MSLDPIQYPTIAVGDRTLPVRFRISDLFALKGEGIDVFAPPDPPLKGLDALERTLRILAAGLRCSQPDGAMSWESLSEHFDMTQLAALSETIATAMGKVSTQAAATPALPATHPVVQ
jgi:hypothetical protein